MAVREGGCKFYSDVISLRPFGFFDYNHLQINIFCVETDYFKFSIVCIRTSGRID